MSERKKVIVSGASSGIGRATAIRFAGEGWDVCLTARRQDRLVEVLQKFPAGNHLVCPGDYRDPATAEAIGEAIRINWGRLDALVNCAGVWLATGIDAPPGEWRRAFDIMVDGAMNLTHMAVPFMKDGGRIIHVTSIHGDRVEKGGGGYAMAKAAINQYCRALALDLAPRGILANAIAPGFVNTEMSIVNGVNELETEWFRQNYVEGPHLPLRRAGRAEEIAGVAWFLAGPDASYVTGQVIIVDGGLTITF